MKNITTSSKRVQLFSSQLAGASTLTSSVVDMLGYDSALFEVLIGGLTTGQTKGVIQVWAGNAADGSDAALLGGASITIQDADTNKLECIEIVKPAGFRYLKLVVQRNLQACAISGVVSTLYGSHRQPTSDDASTVAQTLCVVDPEYVAPGLTVVTGPFGNSTTQMVTTYRSSS